MSKLTVLVVFAFLGTNAERALRAQCPIPAGTYTMSITPGSPIQACPGQPVTFDVVGATGGGGSISGFGLNMSITGGPITGLTIVPGFGVLGQAFFISQVAPGGLVAAVGGDPFGPGITTLATVGFVPTTAAPLTISFGGSLALSTGQAPIDHLVVA